MRKGFTLFEIVIAAIIVFAAIPALVTAFKWAVETDKRAEKLDYSGIYEFEEDVMYSSALAKSINFDGETLEITRYDGCVIRYAYDADAKTIKKSADCPDGVTEKAIVLGGIKSFDVTRRADGLYDVTLEKDAGDYVFNFKIKELR